MPLAGPNTGNIEPLFLDITFLLGAGVGKVHYGSLIWMFCGKVANKDLNPRSQESTSNSTQ